MPIRNPLALPLFLLTTMLVTACGAVPNVANPPLPTIVPVQETTPTRQISEPPPPPPPPPSPPT
ncbi:MAG: hypothetical protein KDF65_14820 [Anaerolineae bacterium]|nr:hypothetical protein [Anaerolineae bacterium]